MPNLPSTSDHPAPPFNLEEQQWLLTLARQSISHGLNHPSPLPLQPNLYPASLQQHLACFVTLQRNNQLRGCIGSLIAHRPLLLDVTANAYAAAFHDHRFHPLLPQELKDLHIHISILSAPTAFPCSSQDDLLAQLRPHIDGLILRESNPSRPAQSTFLPSVWETLSTPATFLSHLKQKAGLPPDYWSPTLTFQRYTTFSIQEPHSAS